MAASGRTNYGCLHEYVYAGRVGSHNTSTWQNNIVMVCNKCLHPEIVKVPDVTSWAYANGQAEE